MSSYDIRVILFDADGVTQLPGNFNRYMEEQYGWPEQRYQDFFQALFRKKSYKDSLKGNIDFIRVLIENLAEFDGNVDAESFMYEWLHRNIIISKELWHDIKRLSRNGIKCYLASNQEKRRAQYMKNDLGYGSHFDRLYFSCDMGALKPATTYFKKIIKEVGIPPANMLFFDDYEDSVDKARSLGFNAEVYQDFSDYTKILEKYGLPT